MARKLDQFRVYSKEDEQRLNQFCKDNQITRNQDEFYFEIDEQKYRISRYTVKVSKESIIQLGAFKMHKPTIYIKAKRSEVERIYKTLKWGTEKEKEEILNPPKPSPKQTVSKKEVKSKSPKQENLLDFILKKN